MANGSPRERGKAKAQAEAEYLDREPALEAERVMARSRVGFLMEAKQRWHRRLNGLSFETPQGVAKDRPFDLRDDFE